MSTITLQNFRVGSDLTVKVRLKDGGVAIDWSTLSGIRAVLYSDAQSSIAGRCDVTVDGEDPTLLVCRYAATKMQYLGVNRIVVSAKYMGETKTYDKPAFTFVRWTADQEGEQITIEDPEVTVEISVEDISSSILQEAVDAAFTAADRANDAAEAAFTAADRANDAAEAAEHMVDIKTGPAGKSPYKGENGNWFEWDEEAGQYVDTGVRAKGETGDTPDISIGTVTTVEPGTPAGATMTGTPEAPVLNLSIPKGVVGDTPNITVGTVTTGEPGTPVVVEITGTAEAPVLNITIPQGMKGDTGVSADYPITIYNGLDSDATDAALSAAQGKVLDGKISQLQQKSAKLKTKSKAEMVKLANAYIYWTSFMAGNGWQNSSNFELYAVRAKGVKAIYAKVYDTSAAEMAIGFFSGSNINSEEAISSACIRSTNGAAEYWITNIPAEAKWITYCNRSASGTGEFVIYYEDEEAQPEYTLFIDELLNSNSSSGKLSNNSTNNSKRVVSKSVCSFPRQGMRIFVKMPIGVRAYMWYSSASGSDGIGTSTTWLLDGDYFDFPKTATHYRIVFASTKDDGLPAENIQALINAGDIAFYYDEQCPNVIDRNAYAEPRAAAVKRNLTGLLDGMDSMFVLAHISDLHGDSVRLINFAKYCNHYGVDAACNSGDSVMYQAENYTSFAQKIMSMYPSVPYLFCIGNHEVYNASIAVWTQGVFGDNISPLVSAYGYLKASETPADDCYYYKDFVDKKIRIIALCYYNDATYNGSLGQAQINWFIATLSSTPSEYGILVMLHSPEDKVVVAAPYDTFRQKVRVTTYQENGFYVGDRPIMHIVDAFIGRTSYSGSYSDNGTTVTINADFSAITDDTIQFIAYIVGHRHEDWIGYYEHATHKQLSLGVTAGTALYGHGSNPAFANQEDLPRGGEGVCQDAFNLYGIDRIHNVVKVARIGSDLTFDFVPREYMEIPYAD